MTWALPLAAQDFEPEAATRAWLDSVPAEVRERSDAYFEGGYWLLLWGTLYTLGVAYVLLRFGISSRLRAWAEKLTRFRFVHALLYGQHGFKRPAQSRLASAGRQQRHTVTQLRFGNGGQKEGSIALLVGPETR